MHDIVEWLHPDRPDSDEPIVVRATGYVGIGTRRGTDAAVLLDSGSLRGALLWGAVDDEVRRVAGGLRGSPASVAVHELPVDDAAARSAGLVCGGQVSVVVQRAGALPPELLDALGAGLRAILLTDLGTGGCELLPAPRRGAVESGYGATVDEQLARLLAAGNTAAARITDDDQDLLLEVFVPVTRLVLVGDGLMPASVAELAVALGWEPVTVNTLDAAVGALATLGPVGGIVVFSHDPELGPAALAAALGAAVTYVGAMGSRRTQAARAQTLRELGVPESDIERIHGPVGLDLGARNPRETALVICAEFLGVLTGRIPD